MELLGERAVVEAAVDTNVIDRLAGLFASDALLPSQFSDMTRRSAMEPPIAKLILTVLEDGIRCFLGDGRVGEGESGVAYCASRRRTRLQAEAADWVFDYTSEEPFSFNWVCDALSLDREYFRGQLKRKAKDGLLPMPRRSPVIAGNQRSLGACA